MQTSDYQANYFTSFSSNLMNGYELRDLRKAKNLTQEELSAQSGVPKGTISRIESTGEEIKKLNTLEAISKCLGVNVDLATFNEPNERPLYRVNKKTEDNAKLIGPIDYPLTPTDEPIQLGDGRWAKAIPLIREYAYAGYASGWRDHEYIEHLPKHVAIFDHRPHSEYFAFEVIGQSMENFESREMALQSYPEGSTVTARNLNPLHWRNSKLHLHKSKDWIIVTNTGIVLKRIIKHDVERGIITCHSLNPDKEEYGDYEIDLREVTQLLNVIPKV